MADYYRPNFFVNTPDINPYYLQTSGRAGFIVRATLAATLSGNWGMYSGFEICEAAPLPGREEYLNSEKYEIRARDFDAARQHQGSHPPPQRDPQQPRGAADAPQHHASSTHGTTTSSPTHACPPRARRSSSCSSTSIPITGRNAPIEAPLWEFGLPDNASIEVEDLLFGGRFTLYGKTHQIALDPRHNPAIIWRLINPAQGRAP